MAKPKLTLYVDVVSPFAYLAFHVINTSPVFKSCDVNFVPVFLGGIMQACNNTPPLNIKNKGKFINKERLRWAKLFEVPMQEQMPPGFPKNTISIQRALCAVTLVNAQKLIATLEALYTASFAEHQDIVSQDVLLPLLTNIHGKDGAKEILAKSISDEAKRLLKANTDRALEDGSFGLPYFVATDPDGRTETFWGFDHMGLVTEHLGLEKPERSTVKESLKAML